MSTLTQGAILMELGEKLARPGLLGLIGRKTEKRCQQDLEAYFRALVHRIMGLHLEKLIDHSSAEVAKHAVEVKLHNVLRTTTPLLKNLLDLNIQAAMLGANKVHHLAESEDDSPFSDPATAITSDEAALYASIRAGELVSGINGTTQEIIADVIQQGIDDNLGVPGTGSLLRSRLDDMTVYRSRMIASTEMNDAMSEAMLRKLGRIGVSYKQWITASACCDECADNEAASPIPIDDEFPSGDMRPPAHPNCRCAVSGARAPSF